jgi:hypothetical protein
MRQNRNKKKDNLSPSAHSRGVACARRHDWVCFVDGTWTARTAWTRRPRPTPEIHLVDACYGFTPEKCRVGKDTRGAAAFSVAQLLT